MEEFIAVIDESGKEESLEYICLIVGDNESFNANIRKLPSNFTHMTHVPENEKLPLLRKFDFSGKIAVCCINISLKKLRKKIDEYLVKKKSRKNKRIFSQIVGFGLRAIFYKAIWDNNRVKGCEVDKLVYEVDNDILREYLKACGLRVKLPTKAHKLADCVAHANFKKYDLDNVDELDKNYELDFHNNVMIEVRRIVK